MTTYVLVDFANLFHRSKHAIMGDVETKAGMTLHIAFNSFRKMWNQFQADHIVICLEGGSWRKKIYPEYKQNRAMKDALRTRKEVKDDEFFFQVMNEFAEFLDKNTNATVIKETGIEADDIIARWIVLHPNDKHIIFSGDSDFYQLLAENVSIYDGTKDQTISINGITDSKGNPVVQKKNVKVKDSSGRMVTKKQTKILEAPDPEYELFKKVIRGDSSDNIMTAYPGAREKGTQKKPGIQEAFEDRKAKGYNWNSFMLTEWDKTVLVDGEQETTRVRVIDEYNKNKALIDLSAQPDDIKEKIDKAIVNACQKESKSGVGIKLMMFCKKMDLVNIGNNPKDYAEILNAKYR